MQTCGNGTANIKSFFLVDDDPQAPSSTFGATDATDATDALAALAIGQATYEAWESGDCHRHAGKVGCGELVKAKHAARDAAGAIVTYVALTGAATSELC